MVRIDNKQGGAIEAAKESKLIEGYWISGGLIYNKDFSDYRADIEIDQIRLSVRSKNALYRAELNTLSSVLLLTVEELGTVKNLGAKSVKEILLVVKNYLHGTGEIRDTEKDNKSTELFPKENDTSPKKTPEKITSESKLINGYCISDRLIYTFEYQAFTEDVSIDDIGYSGRLRNLLCRKSLFKLSDILSLSQSEARQVKDLGAGMFDELINKTEAYLSSHLTSAQDNNNKVTSDGTIEDMPFEEMSLDLIPFSVRAVNALTKQGYHYIYEVADFTYYDFLNIKNLGAKTAREIYEKIQAFLKANSVKKQKNLSIIRAATDSDIQISNVIAILKSFQQECKNCDSPTLLKTSDTLLERARSNDPLMITSVRESCDVYRMASVIAAIDKNIISKLKHQMIDGMSFDEIKATLPESLTSEMLGERLNTLTKEKTIRYCDRFYINYPSFTDVLVENADDRAAKIISMRMQQNTLEEIAQVMGGLTRERVRQIESKYMRNLFSRYGQMDEDKYKYIFTTYSLNNELMTKYLGFSAETIYFLEYKYKGTNKKLPIDEATLDDPKLPASIKKRIEKYILSQKIRIGNEYVGARRHLVEEALFPILCKDTISAYDFIDQYNFFVTENQKPELLITDDLYRSRINKYANSTKILWTLNQKMRYYDTEAINKSEFLDKLNLDQYHDIEISSKKIFDENSELMAEYDIRNEYELHNLLKKTITPSDCPELVLGRTPFLQFGNADRKRQVVELLSQLTPIPQIDFANAYSELYGVTPTTALSNHLILVKQYLNKDKVLEMDVPSLSEEQLERLKALLPNDVYSMERLLSIFRREYPTEPVEKINHYTLHQLGFHVFSGYVMRLTYRNAQEYFRAILLKGDITDANLFPQEYSYIQTYSSTLSSLLENRDLIEFLPKKYIKISRLTELFGTTKEDIKQFCRHVNEYTDKPFFTVQSLKKDGFDDPLFELGFDDCFYSSLLFYDREYFAHKKMGGTTLFRVGTQQFAFSDFIEWLLYREESMSMDVYELIDLLYDTYGIRFERYEIKSKILPGTQMYYSDITEKLYADYEIYFDEI